MYHSNVVGIIRICWLRWAMTKTDQQEDRERYRECHANMPICVAWVVLRVKTNIIHIFQKHKLPIRNVSNRFYLVCLCVYFPGSTVFSSILAFSSTSKLISVSLLPCTSLVSDWLLPSEFGPGRCIEICMYCVNKDCGDGDNDGTTDWYGWSNNQNSGSNNLWHFD